MRQRSTAASSLLKRSSRKVVSQGGAKEHHACVAVAGKGELDARAKRVIHAHALHLEHLAVLVLGRDLPEHVREVDGALDDEEVQREPGIGLDECLGAGAKLLLANMNEAEVLGNAHRGPGRIEL